MLDLMECEKDFAVVFDYACDVEVHYEDGLEFYQIKSHGINSPAYTCKALTKKDSKNAEGSILGKLYALNTNGSKAIKLALVTNVPLSISKKKIADEFICFDHLSDSAKQNLIKALKKELSISEIDLKNIFYIHTEMNLKNPEEEVQGKIVISFVKIKNCEPLNPRALYRLIVDTVNERACYEFEEKEYVNLIKNKGITRSEFDSLLNCHAINEKTGIQETQQYINKLTDIGKKYLYKKALAKMISIIPNNRFLKTIEKDIVNYLYKEFNLANLGEMESIIEKLISKFHSCFPVEYNNEEKIVFYMITISKFEEGVYSNENDV